MGGGALVALAVCLTGPGVGAALGATACLLQDFSGPPASHRNVNGTIGPACGGGSENGAYAGTFNISIDQGPATLGYCVDLQHPISGGNCEPQSPTPSYGCEVTYILNTFYPNGPVASGLTTADEAAAVQSALWHFTDCFTLNSTDSPNNAALIAEYNAIIAAASANFDPNCSDPVVPQTIDIDPASAINYLPNDTTHSATATVLDNNGQPMPGRAIKVTVSGGPSGPYTFNGTTDANGQFSITYTNQTGIPGVDSIEASTTFAVPVGLEFANGVLQRIVLSGGSRTGTVTGSGTKSWVVAECGDGVVNQGTEQCDDGNATDGDGCDTNCTLTACGNGIQTVGEACDDGNGVDGDGCDANCTLTACGNGVVTAGEACDDGNLISGDGCDSNCTLTACGNGVKTGAEQCDDGNAVNGDGCDNNCTTTSCGNGIQTGAEECDDGNQVNGDACDTNCTTPKCGNGITAGSEQCDDGNAVNGDGCDNNCTTSRCGNGEVGPGEQCDDGNQVNGDQCDNNCTNPRCGNGIQVPPEQCDDGNTTSGDGCDSDCTVTGCGNGIPTAGEECDDGNQVNGDACDNNCTTPRCGNGEVGGSEQCDDGNQVNGDACDNNCTTPRCGNGITVPPEQCDDGNAIDGDGCEANCTLPVCGNGILDIPQGEQCDDGNTVNGDGCSSTCQLQEICTDLIDNDNDGRVDCDDTDCECQLFGKDPAAIIFRPTRPDHDFFKVHGRLVMQNPEVLTGKFGVLLTNANGEIYKGELQAGDLTARPRGAIFVDKTAKTGPGTRGGLYKVKLKNRGSYTQVQVFAYSNLTEATVALMGVQVVVGPDNASYKGEWKPQGSGWRLKLPRN
jgi:cysteine-rich repeat protein